MERWEKRIFIFAMVSLFIVSFWSIAFAQEIKIGVIGPMQFVQGKGHWNGATMAAEEINAKGGILRYADAWGIRNVYEHLLKLEQEHGVRFKPASLLKEMAESGRTFYKQ